MRLDTASTMMLLGTWMVTFQVDCVLTIDDESERPTTDSKTSPPPTTTGHEQQEEEGEPFSSSLREKRDGYGGGSSYSSGGSYGCNCPHQYCDDSSDLLLYFSAGALLGLLFSLLNGGMMMMPTPAPPPPMMGGRNVEGSDSESVPTPPSTTAHLLNNLPSLLTNDIAPLAMDIMKVYTESEKHPECIRRWICELTQKSMKQGGLRARITSVTSVALSWILKDMMPFLENLDSSDHFDCSILAHECKKGFDRPPVAYD